MINYVYLSLYCEVTKKDMIEKCPDISVNMIEYHLKELLEQDFIKKVKSGRYSSYIRIIRWLTNKPSVQLSRGNLTLF